MVGAQTIKQSSEMKARSVLKKLAEDARSMEEVKTRVVQTVDTIKVIQRRWRHIRMIRSFQQEIVKNMWDKEMEIIENYWLKLKPKNKKLKVFYNKLISIDPQVKDKILYNYMELSRWRHWVLFSKWRLNQLSHEIPGVFDGKAFLDESQSHDDAIDSEIDYLMSLVKFKSEKAFKIRRSLFIGVEPGILDLELLSMFLYNVH